MVAPTTLCSRQGAMPPGGTEKPVWLPVWGSCHPFLRIKDSLFYVYTYLVLSPLTASLRAPSVVKERRRTWPGGWKTQPEMGLATRDAFNAAPARLMFMELKVVFSVPGTGFSAGSRPSLLWAPGGGGGARACVRVNHRTG